MKDKQGLEVHVGDSIAFTSSALNDLHLGEIINIYTSHGPYGEVHDIDVADVRCHEEPYIQQNVVSKEIALIPSFEEVEY